MSGSTNTPIIKPEVVGEVTTKELLSDVYLPTPDQIKLIKGPEASGTSLAVRLSISQQSVFWW